MSGNCISSRDAGLRDPAVGYCAFDDAEGMTPPARQRERPPVRLSVVVEPGEYGNRMVDVDLGDGHRLEAGAGHARRQAADDVPRGRERDRLDDRPAAGPPSASPPEHLVQDVGSNRMGQARA